jgi:uncharacterized protein DUF2637
VRSQSRWERLRPLLAVAAVVGIVAAITANTAVISYEHEYELARHNQQAAWVSALVPFSVDGMILVASVALLWAAAHRIKGFGRLWRPVGVLMVGVGATIAANYFADLRFGWLGPAVSASSGVAMILVSDVAFWLIGEWRQLGEPAEPDEPQPVVACSCLPPPTSLAEAAVAAREELRRRGEPAGEQVLADRFETSRYKIRTALGESGPDVAGTVAPRPAVPATPSLNGDGHEH